MIGQSKNFDSINESVFSDTPDPGLRDILNGEKQMDFNGPVPETLDKLMIDLVGLEDGIAYYEQMVKDMRKRKVKIEEALNKALEYMDLSNVKSPKNGTFFRKENVFVNVKKEFEKSLHDWLKSQGAGDLIKKDPTVNGNTLKAFIKERLEADLSVPEFVKVTRQKAIGRRRK